MTKSRFLIEAVLSLNKGDSGYYTDRVDMALNEYNSLVCAGVIFDEEGEE